MAKLGRYLQKVFGSTASTNQIAQFGSLANGTPARYSGTTIDPSLCQNLSRYSSGWFASVVGSNSPAIEDMNALHYLFSFQLAYLMQQGIAEYDGSTTYYTGSIVQGAGAYGGSSGMLFLSRIDNNSGNALTDTTKWKTLTGMPEVLTYASSPFTPASIDNGDIYQVDVTNGIVNIALPSAFTLPMGYSITVIDYKGLFSTSGNYATFTPSGSQQIEGLNVPYNMQAPWGIYRIYTDTLNWYFK